MAVFDPLVIINSRVTVMPVTDALQLSTLQELHASVVTSPMQFQLMSALSHEQPIVPGVAVSYFVYVGYTVREVTANFCAMQVLIGGDPQSSDAFGIYSSPDAPNKAGQTLTRIVATNSLDADFSALSVVRNTSDFATVIPAKTHLWAAFGSKFSPTLPSLSGLSYDFGEGQVLWDPSNWDLPNLDPIAADLLPIDSIAVVPDIRLELQGF